MGYIETTGKDLIIVAAFIGMIIGYTGAMILVYITDRKNKRS